MSNKPIIHFRIESTNNECLWLHFLSSGTYYYQVLYLNEQGINMLLFELDSVDGSAHIIEEESNFIELTELLNCTIADLKQIIEKPFQSNSTQWQTANLRIYIESELFN